MPKSQPAHAGHAPVQIPPSPAWWKTPRAKTAGQAFLGIIAAGLVAWFFFFRPYVSTDDARVAATLIRLAPEGQSGLRITAVNVMEGDEVKTGQVLVELDRRMAEAQLSRARAQATLAGANFKRTQQLAGQKGVPQRDLDTARAAAEGAEADLRLAEIALERCTLKSPVDGLVVQKTAEVGNILEPGQAALALADVEHAWVTCNVEETSVGAVKVGQKVTIHVDEGGSLEGKVLAVAAASASQFAMIPADNPSGNFTKLVQRIPIKIGLLPHPDIKLRAGQSVEVHIRVR